jgi:hypothetical protein
MVVDKGSNEEIAVVVLGMLTIVKRETYLLTGSD